MGNPEDLREINQSFSIFKFPFMSLVHRNNSQLKLLHRSLGRGQGGGGRMAMEFPWAWNIFKNFLINLCKGRVILEGVNIFFENSVPPLRLSLLRLGSYKSQANGRSWGEWTKVSPFLFEIEHHGVTSDCI